MLVIACTRELFPTKPPGPWHIRLAQSRKAVPQEDRDHPIANYLIPSRGTHPFLSTSHLPISHSEPTFSFPLHLLTHLINMPREPRDKKAYRSGNYKRYKRTPGRKQSNTFVERSDGLRPEEAVVISDEEDPSPFEPDEGCVGNDMRVLERENKGPTSPDKDPLASSPKVMLTEEVNYTIFHQDPEFPSEYPQICLRFREIGEGIEAIRNIIRRDGKTVRFREDLSLNERNAKVQQLFNEAFGTFDGKLSDLPLDAVVSLLIFVVIDKWVLRAPLNDRSVEACLFKHVIEAIKRQGTLSLRSGSCYSLLMLGQVESNVEINTNPRLSMASLKALSSRRALSQRWYVQSKTTS